MDGAKEVLNQQGRLLVEAFDRAAKEWSLESDRDVGSRHFTKIFNAYKRQKAALINYLRGLEENRAGLNLLIEGRDQRIVEGRRENEERLRQIHALEAQNAGLVHQLAERDMEVMTLTEHLREKAPEKVFLTGWMHGKYGSVAADDKLRIVPEEPKKLYKELYNL